MSSNLVNLTLLFFSFLAVRLTSAMLNPISDCDETFNYWEPLHFVIFGKGKQTWEYCPRYALRSYAYIYLHAKVLLFVSSVFGVTEKVEMFFLIRGVFAFVSAVSESFFVYCTEKALGNHVSFALWVFMLGAPGMFQASTSFLPQTFVLYFVLLTYSQWVQRPLNCFGAGFVVSFMGIGCLLGWPFAGIIAVPMGLHLVYSVGFAIPFVVGLVISTVVLVGSALVDYGMYQKGVIAVWNIVRYNQVGTSGEGGADIYGTEPFKFYLLNLFLNFNIVSILFLAFPLFAVSHWIWHRINGMQMEKGFYSFPLLLSSPGFLWFAVFQSMAHKEERFLYVIYPIIALTSAMSLELVRRTGFKWSILKWVRDKTRICVFALFLMLSVSRITSQVKGFGAPLRVYSKLSSILSQNDTICVGKEWYRFPSTFFLPYNTSLHFVESGFDGLLPSDFSSAHSPCLHANNRNEEDVSIYFRGQCDYLVDLVEDSSDAVYAEKFVDVLRSPSPYRSFYIPFLSESKCDWKWYSIISSPLTA